MWELGWIVAMVGVPRIGANVDDIYSTLLVLTNLYVVNRDRSLNGGIRFNFQIWKRKYLQFFTNFYPVLRSFMYIYVSLRNLTQFYVLLRTFTNLYKSLPNFTFFYERLNCPFPSAFLHAILFMTDAQHSRTHRLPLQKKILVRVRPIHHCRDQIRTTYLLGRRA